MAWSVGDFLTHRFNPELGIGRVTAVEGRILSVHFPKTGTTLKVAATADALVRADPDAPPVDTARVLFDRLAAGELDSPEDFLIRMDILRLLSSAKRGDSALFSADASGSFLTSCTSPSARRRTFPSAGCLQTKWVWAKRSKRA